MGALAFLDALGVGKSIELATADGIRAVATGVDGTAGGFATLNALGIFPVTQFGAVGDGVTNDRPAIVAADLAAAAFGGIGTKGGTVFFPNPPVAYLTDQELTPTIGNAWLGTAAAKGECSVRASVAMRSVIKVNSTSPAGGGTPVPMRIEQITFDANNLAKFAALGLSCWFTSWRSNFFINAVLDCYHDGDWGLPLVIGAVTTAGGAPAGLVVTQTYNDYQALGAGAVTVVLQIDGTGTKYAVSTDGGAHFGTLLQSIGGAGAVSQPIIPTTPTAGTPGALMGLLVTFPAGPYPAGGTWTFTCTQNQPAGQIQGCINVEHELDNNFCDTSGYPIQLGTVTIAAGSRVGTGALTNWLSGNAGKVPRVGDSITIQGAGPGGIPATFPLLGIGDDGTFYLPANANVQTSVAGAAYTISVGWSVYRGDVGDQDRMRIKRGRYANSQNGIRSTGQVGDHIETVRVETGMGGSGIGICAGRTSQGSLGFTFINPEIKAGVACRFFFYFGSSGTLIEPQQDISITVPSDFQGFGSAMLQLNGSLTRYTLPENQLGAPLGNTVMSQAVGTLQFVSQFVAVTSANQVLLPPIASQSAATQPSYTLLQPNGTFVGANALVLGAPASYGMLWILENISNGQFWVGFRDKRLSGIAADPSLEDGCLLALAQGERVLLWSGQPDSSFTVPRWVQFGRVHRVGAGPSVSLRGSGLNGDGNYAQTTSAAAVTLQSWELLGQLPQGGMVVASVSARDFGSASRAAWDRCMAFVDSTGALVAQVVPTTNATGAFGTNAGLPPAGWAPSFAVSGGFLNLNVTTGAAINGQWLEVHKSVACDRHSL